jgi:ABC-2 type transport system permease protein
MNNLVAMFWIEVRKAIRSKVPLLTALGFLLVPFVGAFLMLIYKDPEFARKAGLISAKANLVGGSADWPTYLGFLAQAVAVGGFMIFSFIATWVFGREFADGTLKDLLAVPVPRGAILAAKFLLVASWCTMFTILIYLVALPLGALVVLPQASSELFYHAAVTLVVTAGLILLSLTPVVFFAGVGRGYLLPLGIAVLAVVFANVAGIIGWGDYFPWSVPALYAGFTGEGADLAPVSYWIVILTGLAGMLATYVWWRFADHDR